MADTVTVPDLHFCEIGQERDRVIVDVGQLPAIKGRHSPSAVSHCDWNGRGRRTMDSAPGDESHWFVCWRRFYRGGKFDGR
jgi:hypothetical protein